GEVPHNLAEQADLFFDEGVGSVFGEPLARLGAAQSLLGLNRELGKHPLDRHLLEIDRGLLGRSRNGLLGNGGHGLLLGTRYGNLQRSFPKITRLGLWIEIKDRPLAPGLELEIPAAGAARKRRSRIWLIVRLLHRALESVRHRQLDVDGARRDRLL